jgi:DNA-directed RNA polymerase specialized sigma24 family protein
MTTMTAIGSLLAQNQMEVAESNSAATSVGGVEQNLIARVQAGEADAFYHLVRPYERAVFCPPCSLTRNDADAEEVAQEAMLKAFKYIGSFRREAKFSTWLIQIAINEAKMKIRKNRRHLYDSIEESRCPTMASTFLRTLPTGARSRPKL